jgi:hypothetical protein
MRPIARALFGALLVGSVLVHTTVARADSWFFAELACDGDQLVLVVTLNVETTSPEFEFDTSVVSWGMAEGGETWGLSDPDQLSETLPVADNGAGNEFATAGDGLITIHEYASSMDVVRDLPMIECAAAPPTATPTTTAPAGPTDARTPAAPSTPDESASQRDAELAHTGTQSATVWMTVGAAAAIAVGSALLVLSGRPADGGAVWRRRRNLHASGSPSRTT